MFSILNVTKTTTSLDWLGIDIHSHLLPGLEDGCEDLASAIKLVSRLKLLGISEFHITPRINQGDSANARKTIRDAAEQLQKELDERHTEAQIHTAGIYLVDEHFENVFQHEALVCLPGGYVLLQLPAQKDIGKFDQYLFGLCARGYRPILAHPERYAYYNEDMERYKRHKDKGCLFQMNILSPEGYYGAQTKQAAQRLLKEGLVDLVGTDLRRPREMYAIERFVLSGNAYRSFRKNPIINAEIFKAPNV